MGDVWCQLPGHVGQLFIWSRAASQRAGGLGAAETNETSAPGHSFFPGHPIVAAQYLERRPGLTITGERRGGDSALLYIPANISQEAAARRGPALTREGGITRLGWPSLYQPPHTSHSPVSTVLIWK